MKLEEFQAESRMYYICVCVIWWCWVWNISCTYSTVLLCFKPVGSFRFLRFLHETRSGYMCFLKSPFYRIDPIDLLFKKSKSFFLLSSLKMICVWWGELMRNLPPHFLSWLQNVVSQKLQRSGRKPEFHSNSFLSRILIRKRTISSPMMGDIKKISLTKI